MKGSVGLCVALAVGYVAGARAGGKNLDELSRSLKALTKTDEFAEVIAAVRAQVAAVLRATATLVDGEPNPPEATADLVARVRYLRGDG